MIDDVLNELAHEEQDTLERDFERNPTVEASPDHEESFAGENPPEDPSDDGKVTEAPLGATTAYMPVQDALGVRGRKNKVVMEGVCSHCAHCGIGLKDAVSIQRGIGPICSKRGYNDPDPEQVDEMGAMFALGEYPELVKYLNDHWKSKGHRGLMNGLVRIASLNRKTPVHEACCDAIDSLGWRKLASTLRESLAVMEIKDSKTHAEHFEVWIKKTEYKYAWSRDMRVEVPHSFFSRPLKAMVVPKKNKRELWNLMLRHYAGLCAKTPSGTVKILLKNDQGSSD
jgi:hypothetical protein